MQKNNDNEELDNIECNNEARDKIKLRLLDIQTNSELNSIDLNFKDRRIPLKSISLQHAEERCKIYENVSKLGVQLMSDYDFFKDFIVQSSSRNPLYETAMENLGYQRDKRLWYMKMRPNSDVVIDLVYKYCFYSYVVQVKKVFQAKNNNNNNYRPNGASVNESGKGEKLKTDTNRRGAHGDNEKRERKDNFKRQPSRERRAKTPEPFRAPKNKVDEDRCEKKAPEKQRSVYIEIIDNKHMFNQWPCKVCQSINSYNSVYCVVCGMKEASYEGWNCPTCTLKNKPRSVNCEACLNPRRL